MTLTPQEPATKPAAGAGGEGRAERPLAPLAKGTLGRRLIVRVVLLVALIALLLSLFSALASYRVMVGQIDHQLDAATARIDDAPYGRSDDNRRAPGGLLGLPGTPIGTVLMLVSNTRADAAMLTEGGSGRQLTTAAADQLRSAATRSGYRTIELAGLGRYRLKTIPADSGTTVVVGLPLADVDASLAELAQVEAALIALALAIALLVTRTVVVRNLRPLHRLTATATQVSQLNLERGEVDLSVRVPAQDAQPDNEVGRVGTAFNHMLANVQGAFAARHASETKLRQFVADASHELRNPLAAIKGYAELTRRGRADLPADTAFAMGRIEAESERMSRLVEDLLLLARLDTKSDLRLTPTDLTVIILNAVSDARVAGPSHTWVIDLPPEPVSVLADGQRLHQVVVNLLANARTHTPPGTTVRTSLAVEQGFGVVRVHDNGPGIAPDIVDRVFERFTRADESRVRRSATGSTGLGLAIVAAVVDAHHGTTDVTSIPGDTTFTVRIPLAPS